MRNWKTETDFAIDRVIEILHWVFPEEIAAGDEAKRIAAETAEAREWEETRELAGLALSARTHNALCRSGNTSVEELRNASDKELLKIRNIGNTALRELRRKL